MSKRIFGVPSWLITLVCGALSAYGTVAPTLASALVKDNDLTFAVIGPVQYGQRYSETVVVSNTGRLPQSEVTLTIPRKIGKKLGKVVGVTGEGERLVAKKVGNSFVFSLGLLRKGESTSLSLEDSGDLTEQPSLDEPSTLRVKSSEIIGHLFNVYDKYNSLKNVLIWMDVVCVVFIAFQVAGWLATRNQKINP